MKKFKFTLQKLMEIREQQLKQEKEKLNNFRKKKISLEQEKANILIKYQKTNEKFNKDMKNGLLTVVDIQYIKNYLVQLREESKRLDEMIFNAEKAVEKQTKVVIDNTMDLKIIEKLKEQKLKEYNFGLLKDEEIFIEEYINTSKFMKDSE